MTNGVTDTDNNIGELEKITTLWKQYNNLINTLPTSYALDEEVPFINYVISDNIFNQNVPKNILITSNTILNIILPDNETIEFLITPNDFSSNSNYLNIQLLDDLFDNCDNILPGSKCNFENLGYNYLEYYYKKECYPTIHNTTNQLYTWFIPEPSNGRINNSNTKNLLKNTIAFLYDPYHNTYKYRLYIKLNEKFSPINFASYPYFAYLDYKSGFLYFYGGSRNGDNVTFTNIRSQYDTDPSPPYLSYIRYNGNTGFDNVEMSGNIKIDGSLNVSEDISINGTINNVKIKCNETNFTNSIGITNHSFANIRSQCSANTIIGVNAVNELRSGGDNSVFGYDAGKRITSGHNNTIMGSFSTQSLESGNYNVGIGSYSLYYTTGSFNTALGTSAGDQNVGGINNVYIGYNSGNPDRGQTNNNNEIVIGARTIGNGSDTVTIGNSEIKEYYFNTNPNSVIYGGSIKVNNNDATVVLTVKSTNITEDEVSPDMYKCMRLYGSSAYWWGIYINASGNNQAIKGGNEQTGDLIITYKETNENNAGVDDTGGGGDYEYGGFYFSSQNKYADEVDFTGQHRSLTNKNLNKEYYGLIVVSSGKFINLDNSIKPKINESLCVVELSKENNSKNVYGIISNKEENSDNFRTYKLGGFGQKLKKSSINEDRIIINSLGEGAIWVCNKNGSFNNGDYITSSVITGYGVKQDDNILYNYTVAKITCNCDFNLTKKYKQKIKQNKIEKIVKKQQTEIIKKTKVNEEIIFDESLNKYIKKKIVNEISEEIELYDEYDLYDESGNILQEKHKVNKFIDEIKYIYEIDYDENGDIIFEDDLDASGNPIYEYTYDTRFLDENANILSGEEEYLTRLNNGENVYIACFVGCTYHCG